MTDLSIVLSESVDSSGGTYGWMSPELYGTECRLTCESECYALGMVIHEVSWLRSSRRFIMHIPVSDRHQAIPQDV